jgi:hypothetical protein
MIKIKFSPIECLPEVNISDKGPVSKSFLNIGIKTFQDAAYYVNRLPYGVNLSSENAMIIFSDAFGTCYTKHGVIARLAKEIKVPVFRYEGFYPLTDLIITGVDSILAVYDLPFIPRTHCFLKYRKFYIDLTEGNCTGKNRIIESYLHIFKTKPVHSQNELENIYRKYFAELCAKDNRFNRIGVDKMFEVLKQCAEINNPQCKLTLKIE